MSRSALSSRIGAAPSLPVAQVSIACTMLPRAASAGYRPAFSPAISVRNAAKTLAPSGVAFTQSSMTGETA